MNEKKRWIKIYNVNNSAHYDLHPIVLQNNSSIIVGRIRGKDGLKYKMQTIVHIMTYWLFCYNNNSSIIVDWIREKDGIKYKM